MLGHSNKPPLPIYLEPGLGMMNEHGEPRCRSTMAWLVQNLLQERWSSPEAGERGTDMHKDQKTKCSPRRTHTTVLIGRCC